MFSKKNPTKKRDLFSENKNTEDVKREVEMWRCGDV